MLCARDASVSGASRIEIHSPDSDVFIIALRRYPELCRDTFFVTGKGPQIIPIGVIYERAMLYQVSTLSLDPILQVRFTVKDRRLGEKRFKVRVRRYYRRLPVSVTAKRWRRIYFRRSRSLCVKCTHRKLKQHYCQIYGGQCSKRINLHQKVCRLQEIHFVKVFSGLIINVWFGQTISLLTHWYLLQVTMVGGWRRRNGARWWWPNRLLRREFYVPCSCLKAGLNCTELCGCSWHRKWRRHR